MTEFVTAPLYSENLSYLKWRTISKEQQKDSPSLNIVLVMPSTPGESADNRMKMKLRTAVRVFFSQASAISEQLAL